MQRRRGLCACCTSSEWEWPAPSLCGCRGGTCLPEKHGAVSDLWPWRRCALARAAAPKRSGDYCRNGSATSLHLAPHEHDKLTDSNGVCQFFYIVKSQKATGNLRLEIHTEC